MSRENQERILEVALSVLSRRGYENTTIRDIAEAAGVAQGLIHYYFRSKQHLVVAALLVCCQKMALDLESATDAGAAFEVLRTSLTKDADFHRMFVQMIGVGLHDEEVGAGVLEFMTKERDLVERIAARLLGPGQELDPRTLRALGAAFWGANLGVIIQNLADPAFDADATVDALALMAEATVAFVTAGGAGVPARVGLPRPAGSRREG